MNLEGGGGTCKAVERGAGGVLLRVVAVLEALAAGPRCSLSAHLQRVREGGGGGGGRAMSGETATLHSHSSPGGGVTML
jgi:hypothetical protein